MAYDEGAADGDVERDAKVVADDDYPPTPWHLKLLLVALVLYLAWRGFQLIAWLVGELF